MDLLIECNGYDLIKNNGELKVLKKHACAPSIDVSVIDNVIEFSREVIFKRSESSWDLKQKVKANTAAGEAINLFNIYLEDLAMN